MIQVKALQDDACHWYLVPNDECAEFSRLINEIYAENTDAEIEFDEKFGRYRVGGDLNNTQLFIQE